MENPSTVQEVLTTLTRTRAEWEAHIAPLKAEELTQPNVCGWWSVKDVIAHLGWYEDQMVKMLELHSLDTGTDYWELPLDERNALIEKIYKDHSAQQVVQQETEIYTALITLICAMRDEELSDPKFFIAMPPNWSALELLRQNTWQHYADHMPDIIKALS